MYVCLSVASLLFKFTHTFWHVPLVMQSRWGWRTQKSTPQWVQINERWLTTQQKDERKDHGDRRWLVGQHLSNLLGSLTHEQDRQSTAWCRLNHASSFAISSDWTFHVLGMRHTMRICIPSYVLLMNAIPLISHLQYDRFFNSKGLQALHCKHFVITVTLFSSVNFTKGSIWTSVSHGHWTFLSVMKNDLQQLMRKTMFSR